MDYPPRVIQIRLRQMTHFSMLCLLFCCTLIYAEELSRSPALANSNWPIAHANTWNSDSTSSLGPENGKNAVSQFIINGNSVKDIKSILETADPITLVQSSVVGYSWGSSVSSVFQMKTD